MLGAVVGDGAVNLCVCVCVCVCVGGAEGGLFSSNNTTQKENHAGGRII